MFIFKWRYGTLTILLQFDQIQASCRLLVKTHAKIDASICSRYGEIKTTKRYQNLTLKMQFNVMDDFTAVWTLKAFQFPETNFLSDERQKMLTILFEVQMGFTSLKPPERVSSDVRLEYLNRSDLLMATISLQILLYARSKWRRQISSSSRLRG